MEIKNKVSQKLKDEFGRTMLSNNNYSYGTSDTELINRAVEITEKLCNLRCSCKRFKAYGDEFCRVCLSN